MATKLYVGNLPFNFASEELRHLFEPFGAVRSAEVVMDRMTGRSRGFGFVEMDSAEGAAAAIQGTHDSEVGGRRLLVNEARERTLGGLGERRTDGGGSGGNGGFRGGTNPPRTGGGGFHGGGGFRSGGGGQRSGGGREGQDRGRGPRSGGDKGRGRSRERWGGDDDRGASS